mmetsp:Transcript_13087/g.39581  ORF Transcript_13087/g.39581 Transcript_13087/m.39581 type:complete len:386 (-) Transcript_13087:271-1428(-)
MAAREDDKPVKVFTVEEVAKHNTEKDCYIIVHRRVYDVTQYLDDHPGGYELIFRDGGKDATSDFEGMFHSAKARDILEEYFVGVLEPKKGSKASLLSPMDIKRREQERARPGGRDSGTGNRPSGPYGLGANPFTSGMSTFKKSVLSPSSFDEFEVVKLEPISPDTKVITLKARLPTPFTVGTHVVIRVDTNGEHVERSYTPLSARFGKLELLVKKYEGGVVSTHCHSLRHGDRLILRGPKPTFGPSFKYEVNMWKSLCLVAGGTGITPMWQFISELLKSKTDKTNIRLLYANRTEKDILLQVQLDTLVHVHKERFLLKYILSEPSDAAAEMKGRLDKTLLEEFLSETSRENTKIFVCGPPGFNKVANEALQELEYTSPEHYQILE